MNPIKVSVCIPVYNCEKHIKEAIDSVLKQTMQDFEIIILDNHSTDKTVDVVNSYNDPRIKLFINDTNIGMLANWNKVMTHAKGDYIKVLPADDSIHTDCLELQSDVLDEDKNKLISLVCGRKNIITDDGKVLFTRGFSRKSQEVTGYRAINKTIRSGGNIIGEPGVVMFRREILEKTGFFEDGIYFTIDLDLWFRMLLLGNLYVLKNIIYDFRISSGSISVNIIGQQRKDLIAFVKKIYSIKAYRLSKSNYRIGLLNSFIITYSKKMLYKFLIK